jgi:dihydrodipicolinate synthase/N-acetylneuraminate lyase
MSKRNMLDGIIIPVITPLNEEGNVDLESTRKLTDYLIKGGVHTLFILGTTGEGPLLPLDEQVKFAETVVEHTDGRLPVIAGISETSSARVLDVVKKLTPTGLDAFVSTLPYYDNTNVEEQIRYFEILADKSEIPISIYDNPYKAGQVLDDKVIVELKDHDNVIGLKDSSSNIRKFRERVEKFGSDSKFAFVLGHSDVIDLSIYFGAAGVVPSDAHLFPELCVSIYDNAAAGNWTEAEKLQRELNTKRVELYSKYPKNSRANNKVCKKVLVEKDIIKSDVVVEPYI